MHRYFNTAGPCRPDLHYMLPAEQRLPDVGRLIESQLYFVVHAPRQVGKTTAFRALAERLTAEGRFAALHTSCEAGQTLGEDLEGAVAAVLDTLRQDAELRLPEDLRPPAVDSTISPRTRFRDLLSRWARQCPRPVVLFLDEIDALRGESLVSILRQLRSGYPERPEAFPASVALVGLRDVREYRLFARDDEESLGTASPFNIKVRSLTLRLFTAVEVAELYDQHAEATGQRFTDDAKARAFELTGGHPWLVNALAEHTVSEQAIDPPQPIGLDAIEVARAAIIERRDTHLDSLIDRLREPRVRRVVSAILTGETLPAEVMDDDLQLVLDLGLVAESATGLEIANPIYREVVPRALTSVLEQSIVLPRASYLDEVGRLDMDRLLDDFRAFWREHAESFLGKAPYSEAAAQLVFMAFLHKVVNGGGSIQREYAVGRGRIDLLVTWPASSLDEPPATRWALELKVWRDGAPDPEPVGRDQLSDYLDRLGLEEGTLLIFDARSTAAPLPARESDETVEHRGRRLRIVRL